jgi:hypothetical protein
MPGQVVGVKSYGYTQSKRRFPAFIEDQPFSQSEQALAQKYIDGRTIYCKSIEIPAGTPNNVLVELPHDIVGLANLVKVEGSLIDGEGNHLAWNMPLDGLFATTMRVTSENIAFYITDEDPEAPEYTGWVAIFYTKT